VLVRASQQGLGVIWKLNLIPHLLDGEHPLPLSGRAQRWQRRGRAVLKELQVQRAAKTYALGEDVLQEVAKKLDEVRDLLAVEGGDLSATISFCLEEVVRESQPALSKFYITRGAYKPRGKRKDKGKKKGEGKNKGKGEGEEEGGGDDDGGGGAAVALDEGSEDEEEVEGEGERGAAGGQSNGKRPADGEGVDSASKGKKPKKLT
jgi:hypothetical protein